MDDGGHAPQRAAGVPQVVNEQHPHPGNRVTSPSPTPRSVTSVSDRGPPSDSSASLHKLNDHAAPDHCGGALQAAERYVLLRVEQTVRFGVARPEQRCDLAPDRKREFDASLTADARLASREISPCVVRGQGYRAIVQRASNETVEGGDLHGDIVQSIIQTVDAVRQ